MAESKLSAEVNRTEIGVLNLKKLLTKPASSTRLISKSSKDFPKICITEPPRESRCKKKLMPMAQSHHLHDTESTRSRGSHRSHGSDDTQNQAANKASKEKKVTTGNSRLQQV